MRAPLCCGAPARLTTGAEIYPHRVNLTRTPFWRCDTCQGHVGCHGGTHQHLGTPATAEVRAARKAVHQVLDPLWMDAWCIRAYVGCPRRARRRIQVLARQRLYAYLAHHLGLPREECHVGLFDLARCPDALAVLDGLTSGAVRAWAQPIEAAARAAGKPRPLRERGRAAA
ncbi:zinc-finger-containing protein [Methylobacterium nodulans]|uniref:Uncharacterized protein n=1 Tax=Methylobacterium nodulans (strain LMG 21967 / CNCM I-2342 / ORS 2060) TaxID=460265 RepID=B8IAP5_METNO|nr:zinc-finger-containing protein [Methylobacterium nodulans]ACL61090.1 conserved hypothetical protein [Methylobacterium nodulans ORS 2060]